MDLNADLAEGDVLTAADLALLDHVTSASLACGFHAGSRPVMRSAAEACVARGVAIGAHVSFRDREGFGRRPLVVSPDQLAADLVEQWETLVDEVAAVGGTVSYVKPHGALYNVMAVDPDVAATVVRCPRPPVPRAGRAARRGPRRPGRGGRGGARARGLLRPRLRRRTACLVARGAAGAARRRPGRTSHGGPGRWPSTAASTRSTAPGWPWTCGRSASTATIREPSTGPGRSAGRWRRPASNCGPSPLRPAGRGDRSAPPAPVPWRRSGTGPGGPLRRPRRPGRDGRT